MTKVDVSASLITQHPLHLIPLYQARPCAATAIAEWNLFVHISYPQIYTIPHVNGLIKAVDSASCSPCVPRALEGNEEFKEVSVISIVCPKGFIVVR
jgi:hypothetical protein